MISNMNKNQNYSGFDWQQLFLKTRPKIKGVGKPIITNISGEFDNKQSIFYKIWKNN